MRFFFCFKEEKLLECIVYNLTFHRRWALV